MFVSRRVVPYTEPGCPGKGEFGHEPSWQKVLVLGTITTR